MIGHHLDDSPQGTIDATIPTVVEYPVHDRVPTRLNYGLLHPCCDAATEYTAHRYGIGVGISWISRDRADESNYESSAVSSSGGELPIFVCINGETGAKERSEAESLDRRNVQTLDDAIAAAETLVDYSAKKDKKPKEEGRECLQLL
ncbi:hypothetical protein M569_00174 [Genlisea aurea]|uniref:Uncharacterized protein n=1 Tax=Genlisea aurea TaxID=192259 RepID=S8D578_9LAMI|nr:hypothetical protein M569_00174 [Genlisea aurea]